jgi:Ca-activated chloride channel family protein
MDMKILKFILVIVLLFGIMDYVSAQAVRKKVVEGNNLYNEEKFDEALNKYRDAQVHDPESSLLKFNIGDAQYKMNKYEEAIKEYEASLNSDDVLKQAQSYYNIGNTLYRLNKLPESIIAYKQSLELNPDDEDAKYNLEFVRKKLKDQAQKQQQDPQQQQQQQQDQQQQQQNQDQQQQQQQEQEQQSQEEEQQEEKEQQQQQDISKEDAERILNALKEDEEKMKEARKQKVRGRVSVSKDW